MKNVPHWQAFVVLYFIIVAVPVYLVHAHLKKRAYANPGVVNLLLYFIGVIAAAFLMHSVAMWLYFKVLF